MAGAWGCPHENNDLCTRVNNLPCDPGMKGCVLAGRYVFFNGDAEISDAKNARLREKRARAATSVDPSVPVDLAAVVQGEPGDDTEKA